ncbi:hypothetical protein Tco_0920329 [Tanacetum coccineum]
MHTANTRSGSGYQQKDRKPSQNDKTEHGMEKTVQNQGQKVGSSFFAATVIADVGGMDNQWKLGSFDHEKVQGRGEHLSI